MEVKLLLSPVFIVESRLASDFMREHQILSGVDFDILHKEVPEVWQLVPWRDEATAEVPSASDSVR